MRTWNASAGKASGFIDKLRRGLLGNLRSKSIPELNKLEDEADEALRSASDEKDMADILKAIGLIGTERNRKMGAYDNPEFNLALRNEYRHRFMKAVSQQSGAGRNASSRKSVRKPVRGKAGRKSTGGRAVLVGNHVYTEGEKIPAVAFGGHVYRKIRGRWR